MWHFEWVDWLKCRHLLQNRSLSVRSSSASWVGPETNSQKDNCNCIDAKGIHDYSLSVETEFPQSWNCCNVLACCFCSWKFVTVKNRSPIVGILQFWAELVLKRHAICEAIYFLKEGHITILNTFYDLTIQCKDPSNSLLTPPRYSKQDQPSTEEFSYSSPLSS